MQPNLNKEGKTKLLILLCLPGIFKRESEYREKKPKNHLTTIYGDSWRKEWLQEQL